MDAPSQLTERMADPSGAKTLSDLLLQFIEANLDQLDRNETAEEWVASLWKVRNPAGKLKKSLLDFLAIFEPFEDPSSIALRKVLEPLTR